MTDNIFAHEHPESERARGGGFTLWFTGLSGAGKTTIAHLVGPALDGAAMSSRTSTATRSARTSRRASASRRRIATRTSAHRLGRLAHRASRRRRHHRRHPPYDETREKAREMVEDGPFVEVYVNASVEECARRDAKGLYAKAFAGEIKGFTGIDDPYEAPENPEIVVDTEAQSPEESARIVVQKLEELGLVALRGARVSAGATDQLIAPHGGELVDAHRRPARRSRRARGRHA